MQRIERLAYLVLKESKDQNQEVRIGSVLKAYGFNDDEIETLDEEIGRFIGRGEYGYVRDLNPRGGVWVECESKGRQLVQEGEYPAFEQGVKLIFAELESMPKFTGKFAELLRRTGIDWGKADEQLFLKQIEETGYAQVLAKSKEYITIQLTTLGRQFLHGKLDQNKNQTSLIMNHNYHVGQALAVGPNASATNNTVTQNNYSLPANFDFEKLARDLQSLIHALREDATEVAHFAEIGTVAQAVLAAQEKNSSKLLTHLKTFGAWTMGLLSEKGFDQVYELVKQLLVDTPPV